MCFACWTDNGSPQIDTQPVRAAALAVQRLYQDHPTGGQLHAVVDDWNVEDGSLNYRAEKPFDDEERAVFDAFGVLTEQERRAALALAEGFWKVAQ